MIARAVGIRVDRGAASPIRASQPRTTRSPSGRPGRLKPMNASGWAVGRAASGTAQGPGVSRFARVIAICLGASLALAVLTPADFAADTAGYFSYLHSITFDRDLVLANEYLFFGVKEPGLTGSGVSYSPYAVGPAVAWFPFYVLTHAVLLVAGLLHDLPWPADGLSLPYQYSARWGTAFWLLLSLHVLHREMAGRFSATATRLGLLGTVAATPAAYYASVGLTMAHGLAAAWACVCFVGALTVLRSGRTRDWVWCGGALGLLMMTRWQAVAFAFLPLMVALKRIFEDRREFKRASPGLLAGLVAFSPQMLMWKLQYGVWVWMPHYYGARAQQSWFDPSTAHWQDVLWSANKGLFVWTPVTVLCLAGLLIAFRRAPLLVVASGVVFVGTVFLGSSSVDWHGTDAFGSRKFDLMLPFFAWGLARLSEGLLRRPSLVLGLGFAALGLWNVGLIRLRHEGRLDPPTPILRLAVAQVTLASEDAHRLLRWTLGEKGSETWYRLFFGDYIYVTSNPSGALRLGDPGSPYLSLGFSEAVNNEGAPRFRWAAPFSCVKFPIERSRDPLRVSVRVRNAPGIAEQAFQVELNGTTVGFGESRPDWSEPFFFLPPSAQVTGMNRLCFRFSGATTVDGEIRAAAMSVVRLP